MDPTQIGPAVMGAAIPIVGIIAFATIKIARIKAEAERGRLDPEAERRIGALEEQVAALRQGLEEAHERLDFSERLLAKKAEGRGDDAGGR